MFEILTGTGLAASAGLNAYIPLLVVGLAARFSDLVALPAGWRWLENGWVLLIVAVLLAVELVADKVPVVDHVNDVLQTAIRPTAGGLTFGATSTSETVSVSDPNQFFSDHAWVPVVAGIVIALVVHLTKAAVRPVVNATTAGMGAPVVSTAEDGLSVGMALAAILMPLLVLLGIVGFGALVWWALRRRRRLRAARSATASSR